MISYSDKSNKSKFIKIRYCNLMFLFTIVLSFAFCFKTSAAPYTVCTGKEFNQRVKAFLSGNDRGSSIENTISTFERGYNPPDDPAYYVDISEDKDGSVIAYTTNKNLTNVNDKNRSAKDNYTLYWYSDSIVSMNPNAAFMFDKFVRIRNIDLSDFTYLRGLTDTRYMFLECRNLKSVSFKKPSATKEFMLAEMQGMFFSCQSLSNVDLTLFDTKMVDNMDEVFYKCYNLKNIYVDKSRWNIENVRSFTRMFSECHLLRSNNGKKAVDIPEDDYEKYAIPGNDAKEGFIKDTNYEYSDYGEYLSSVPIDGANYLMAEPETTQAYAEEPEYDSEAGGGLGSGNVPYVGNSASGYGDEKQSQQVSNNIITPTEGAVSPNRTTEAAVNETTVSNVVTSEVVDTTENIIIETEIEITETKEVYIEDETSGKRIMELDDFLKSQEEEGRDGKGEVLGGILNDYKFLIFALAISIIAILLLVGMVAYLAKSNRENKDDESHKI